ncbi:MAG: hypothetical protein ACYSWQ_19560 [Planctomycetota bacterium]|jgi:hypothetical protein
MYDALNRSMCTARRNVVGGQFPPYLLGEFMDRQAKGGSLKTAGFEATARSKALWLSAWK